MKIMVAGEVSRSFSAETIPRTWQVHRSTQGPMGRHGSTRVVVLRQAVMGAPPLATAGFSPCLQTTYWKPAQNAVSHSAHTIILFMKGRRRMVSQPA